MQVPVKAPPRPLPVMHAPGIREPGSQHAELRVPSGPPARGKEVRLSSMISSAPPIQPDDVEMTDDVREAMLEIFLHEMESHGSGFEMVQALQNIVSFDGTCTSFLDLVG